MSADHRRCVIDSRESIEALQFLADLRWKDKCSPTPAQSANSAYNFESGKLGMSFDWMGMAPRYRKAINSFDWDVCPIPTGPVSGSTIAKGNQLTVNALTKHPEAAWRFVRYMTSYEVELELYGRRRRNFPTRVAVATSREYLDTSEPPKSTDIFLPSFNKGRQLPIDARWQEWSTAMNSELDALWSGREKSASVAAKRAADAATKVLLDEEGF